MRCCSHMFCLVFITSVQSTFTFIWELCKRLFMKWELYRYLSRVFLLTSSLSSTYFYMSWLHSNFCQFDFFSHTSSVMTKVVFQSPTWDLGYTFTGTVIGKMNFGLLRIRSSRVEGRSVSWKGIFRLVLRLKWSKLPRMLYPVLS